MKQLPSFQWPNFGSMSVSAYHLESQLEGLLGTLLPVPIKIPLQLGSIEDSGFFNGSHVEYFIVVQPAVILMLSKQISMVRSDQMSLLFTIFKISSGRRDALLSFSLLLL